MTSRTRSQLATLHTHSESNQNATIPGVVFGGSSGQTVHDCVILMCVDDVVNGEVCQKRPCGPRCTNTPTDRRRNALPTFTTSRHIVRQGSRPYSRLSWGQPWRRCTQYDVLEAEAFNVGGRTRRVGCMSFKVAPFIHPRSLVEETRVENGPSAFFETVSCFSCESVQSVRFFRRESEWWQAGYVPRIAKMLTLMMRREHSDNTRVPSATSSDSEFVDILQVQQLLLDGSTRGGGQHHHHHQLHPGGESRSSSQGNIPGYYFGSTTHNYHSYHQHQNVGPSTSHQQMAALATQTAPPTSVDDLVAMWFAGGGTGGSTAAGWFFGYFW